MNTDFSGILIDISEPYSFNKEGLAQIEKNRWAQNQWPVVYFIENRGKKIGYIGESTNAIARFKTHLANKKKAGILNQISLIGSDRFNKSAALDIESSLIRYFSAEGSYKLQNGNYGLTTHNYYERDLYKHLFREIWSQLMKRALVRKSLIDVENSQIFKYSPYKSLNKDQYNSLLQILDSLTHKQSNCIFVEGSAGTGKTILATYLVKLLKSDIDTEENDDEDELNAEAGTLKEIRYVREFQKRYPNAKIGLVVAMDSLRTTLKNVFRDIPGLSANMVISPSETTKQDDQYDLLIVDEAHRLRQRKNISWMGAFDKSNKSLGLDNTGTELDWILAKSKNQLFFYDRDQQVRPSDIAEISFLQLLENKNTLRLSLQSQMRVMGGEDYISFVNDLLHLNIDRNDKFRAKDYELLLFDSLPDMNRELRDREEKFGLCRMVAGYAWEWSSKTNEDAVDIEIDGMAFKWNKTNKDWINTENAVNEIGCIHTTMGYDLNYTGIIFGNEIKYNSHNHSIEIDRNSYYDKNGKIGTTPEELKAYIVNIYKNMMYRGIRGTFIYACDPALRSYLKKYIPSYKSDLAALKLLSNEEAERNSRAVAFVDIVAAAGSFSDQQQHEQLQFIELPKEIHNKHKYFVCKVAGESMNKVIPDGSYCLFEHYEGGSREGKIVLVESSDIQDEDTGSSYTIKEYHSSKVYSADGWKHDTITLKPLSNKPYEDIILKEDTARSQRVVGIFKEVIIPV